MTAPPRPSIYFSRFMPTWDLGGGSRRMMQLWEMLKPLGCELRSSARGDGLPADTWQRLKNKGLKGRPYRSWSPQRRRAVFRLREISRIWSRAAGEFKRMDLAFMDDPIYFLPLFRSLERLRVPVVAVCHNLETLAPSQVEEGASMDLLRQELEVLSRCRLVITISSEETWLLNNLRIPCFYLPYHPKEPILGRLLAVRRKRSECESGGKRGILMLVNSRNPQSSGGVDGVIAHWREKRLAKAFGPLLVAGFNSETVLPARLFGDDAQLLGTLENERLDELLARVAACLCYQESGSGAMTRIGEMLIANVPVLANSHAARSYHHMEGVIEFGDLDGLEEALRRLQTQTGEIPLPSVPETAPLLAAIARVLES
jgi:hypothetical protein